MSYYYIPTPTLEYSVGFIDQRGNWRQESTFVNDQDAAARVSFLNGGANPIVTAKILEMVDEINRKVRK